MATIQLYKVKDFQEYAKKHKNFFHEVQCLNSREEIEALYKREKVGEFGEMGEERLCLPSTKYPNHRFKIGQFNTGKGPTGYTRVLSDAVGVTIYDIFVQSEKIQNEVDDGNVFQPDWDMCVLRTFELKKAYKTYLKDFAIKVEFHPTMAMAGNEEEALLAYKNGYAVTTDNIVGIVCSKLSHHGLWIMTRASGEVSLTDEYLKGIEIVEETLDRIWTQRDEYCVIYNPFDEESA